jgi:CubicO group peptidase (beta-lactamase class C family)
MNKKKLGILIIFLLIIPKLATSQSVDSKVDSLYQVKGNKPGFSIAVFKKDDKIMFEKQYGIANLDYNIPINK